MRSGAVSLPSSRAAAGVAVQAGGEHLRPGVISQVCARYCYSGKNERMGLRDSGELLLGREIQQVTQSRQELPSGSPAWGKGPRWEGLGTFRGEKRMSPD